MKLQKILYDIDNAVIESFNERSDICANHFNVKREILFMWNFNIWQDFQKDGYYVRPFASIKCIAKFVCQKYVWIKVKATENTNINKSNRNVKIIRVTYNLCIVDKLTI